ncbi:nitrate/nitrite transporter [uncultured Microscilla sp.]|uniref:MFS transporter n=1 Tax=uncultured Microscilla sp. TaxID=432653 RepID=UPI00261C9EFA|nr:MFS transporter [uncultured Microscilla sp.]
MTKKQKPSIWIIPVIVFSQFAGTSLWFAGNAVLPDLQAYLQLSGSQVLGNITSAVQLGFILGTLVFAFFAISDKFSPRRIFLVCALLGAVANMTILWLATNLFSLLLLRFLTGFFLAGIYPIGMKIAAGWYQKSLGKAIGFLVGALVLGTAFPHLLKSIGGALSWKTVLQAVSLIAAVGGAAMYLLVPDGPYISKGAGFNPKVLLQMFRTKDFRCAAFGYFGHMWELYTFWAYVPVILQQYAQANHWQANLSWWAFVVIAVGSIGCIVGGVASGKIGSAKIAVIQLGISGLMCLLSPLLFQLSPVSFLALLVIWGITVVGDSPQFSALTAQTAPQAYIGSALTIVNSVGFAITIISIQFVNYLAQLMAPQYIFVTLLIGPLFGLWAMYPLYHKK